jgi:heme exporter protein D
MSSPKLIFLGWLCVALSLLAPLAITVHSTTSAEAVFEYVAERKTKAAFTEKQMEVISAGVREAHIGHSEPDMLLEIVCLTYAVGLFLIGAVLVTGNRKKKPNQALEPTPIAVTPRADAQVAPATGVAHL